VAIVNSIHTNLYNIMSVHWWMGLVCFENYEKVWGTSCKEKTFINEKKRFRDSLKSTDARKV